MSNKFTSEEAWVRPKTLAEFLARYPEYVRSFCRNSWVPLWMREDLEQELLLKMHAAKVVESYDPARREGKDTPGLFFSWLHFILMRQQQAVMHRREGDALRYVTPAPEGMAWEEFAEAMGPASRTRAGQHDYALSSQLLALFELLAPAYVPTFRHMLAGCTGEDLLRSTGIPALYPSVCRLVPLIIAGKARSCKASRKLEELGDYPLKLASKKGGKVKKLKPYRVKLKAVNTLYPEQVPLILDWKAYKATALERALVQADWAIHHRAKKKGWARGDYNIHVLEAFALGAKAPRADWAGIMPQAGPENRLPSH